LANRRVASLLAKRRRQLAEIEQLRGDASEGLRQGELRRGGRVVAVGKVKLLEAGSLIEEGSQRRGRAGGVECGKKQGSARCRGSEQKCARSEHQAKAACEDAAKPPEIMDQP
jgi:hypothetical protein